ncbi:MAG: hypothetical protein ACYTEU_04305 [Planctomycetota bacterium]|jgi:uncharacterized membrane protein YeaQ/YmgE (transglycosylase-associated protein family)
MMDDQQQQPGFIFRLHRALGPILGGLLLDFTDLATFGPMGILGPILGAAVVLWISSLYRFSVKTKIILAFLGGVYCTVPMTEPFPIATLVCAACRFFEKPSNPPDDSEDQPNRKFVESKVESETDSDEGK